MEATTTLRHARGLQIYLLACHRPRMAAALEPVCTVLASDADIPDDAVAFVEDAIDFVLRQLPVAGRV